MAKKAKLFLQFVISEESSHVWIWTTDHRRKVELETMEQFVELTEQFTDRYQMYCSQNSDRLKRKVMQDLSAALREQGHSIAF